MKYTFAFRNDSDICPKTKFIDIDVQDKYTKDGEKFIKENLAWGKLANELLAELPEEKRNPVNFKEMLSEWRIEEVYHD